MINILLIFVIGMDLVLLGLVYYLIKQRYNPFEVLKEISNERNILKEMREGIQIEINEKYKRIETLHRKITEIVSEVEHDVQKSIQTVSDEMTSVLDDFIQKLHISGDQISRQKDSFVYVIQKSTQKRDLLKKLVSISEKMSNFFNNKVPYDEVLEDF